MNKTKIFITGASGVLGREFIKQAAIRNINIYTHAHFYTEEYKLNVCGDITKENIQNEICNCIEQNNINVFINNAAIYQNKSFLDFTNSEINDMIQINLLTPVLLSQKIIKIFINKKEGALYNINSVAGIKGTPYESVYCATKFGLKGFTDSISEEFKHFPNIRIVNVTLGAFKSKMTKDRKDFNELSEPSDVANLILDHILNQYSTASCDLIIRRKL